MEFIGIFKGDFKRRWETYFNGKGVLARKILYLVINIFILILLLPERDLYIMTIEFIRIFETSDFFMRLSLLQSKISS